MKKIVLFMLLPLVVSCGGGDNPGPDPTIYHKITFSGDNHCHMYDVVEPYGQVDEKDWEAGSVASYIIKPDEGYTIPTSEQVLFLTSDGKAFEGEHSYDQATGEFSVKMSTDVTVKASTTPIIKTYSFSFETAFCTLSPYQTTYNSGEEVNITLTADDILSVPDDVTVTIGDKIGTNHQDYEYTPNSDHKTATFAITITANTKVRGGAKEASEPLTFTALSDEATLSINIGSKKEGEGTVERSVPFNLEYSADNLSWHSVAIPDPNESNQICDICKIKKDEKIYLRGNNPDGVSVGNQFNSVVYSIQNTNEAGGAGQFAVSGNIMSLISSTQFSTMDSIDGLKFCFYDFFSMTEGIVHTKDLLLPKVLSPYCFAEMFAFCDALVDAPRLRADKLEAACYDTMFYLCDKLEISEEPNDDHIPFFTCPTDSEGCVDDMFTYTKGHDDLYEPESGKTYYFVEQK